MSIVNKQTFYLPNISKVKDSFRVTFDHGINNAGKRIRTYKTVGTLGEAKALLNDFQTNKQRGQVVQPSKMTLSEFMDLWFRLYVDDPGLIAETTAYGYRNIIYNHLLPFLGGVGLQKLQPMDVQLYYEHLRKKKNLLIKHNY